MSNTKERETVLVEALEQLERYEYASATLLLRKAMAMPLPPEQAAQPCSAYKCEAAAIDGVICTNDSCDIATGVRQRPEQAAQPTLRINRSEWRSLSPEAQAKLEKITGALHPDTRRARAEAAEVGRRVPLVAAASPAQASAMDDAIAAGDGTLHGAIDHWQQRALAAEQAAQPSSAEDLLADFCEASGTYFVEVYRPSAKTRQMVSNPIRRDDLLMLIRTARGMEAQVQEPLSAERVDAGAIALAGKHWHWDRLSEAGRNSFRSRARDVLTAAWGVQLTKEGGNG